MAFHELSPGVPLHEPWEGALCTDGAARLWDAQRGHAAWTRGTEALPLKPIFFPDSFLSIIASVKLHSK